MLKSIAKMFCPSSAKLAESAAKSIQAGYNGIQTETREKIAKYSALAKRIGEMQSKLDTLLSDNVIDDAERDKIAAALEPLIESAKDIVFN